MQRGKPLTAEVRQTIRDHGRTIATLYGQGCTQREIAAAIGIPRGSLHSLIAALIDDGTMTRRPSRPARDDSPKRSLRGGRLAAHGQTIAAMYAAGASYSQIARATDIPRGCIHALLDELRLRGEIKGYREPRQRGTRAPAETIIDMVNNNYRISYIAWVLGVSRQQITDRIKTLIRTGRLTRRTIGGQRPERAPIAGSGAPKCRLCGLRLDLTTHPDPRLRTPPPAGKYTCYWCSQKPQPSPQSQAAVYREGAQP